MSWPAFKALLKTRFKTLFKALFWLSLLTTLIAVGVVGYLGWEYRAGVLVELESELAQIQDFRPGGSCRVFDTHGELVDEFYVERRIWVSIETLPEHVWGSFVAAEDRRFFEHPGVDLLGIARAMQTNFEQQEIVQGGSTLTQQLVKNLFVGKERSYKRKLREAVVAVELEERLSKEQLLELYMNYVFLGSGNYGIEAAALDYFRVPARELSPAQAALLAGLIPAPSRYNPRRNPQRATERRGLVLSAMVQEGYITAEQEREGVQETLIAAPVAVEGEDAVIVGAAYLTEVRREVRRLMGEDLAFKEGLRIHTPYDPEIQALAEKAVWDATEAAGAHLGIYAISQIVPSGRRQAFIDAAAGLPRDDDEALRRPEAGDCFEALVADKTLSELRAGPWYLTLKGTERARLVRDRLKEQKPQRRLMDQAKMGDVLRVCVESPEDAEAGVVVLNESLWTEGAAVVLDNATGEVVALTGGRDVVLEGFVRGTQALRQPGSTFKVFVYTAALLSGRSQIESEIDGEITLIAGDGEPWTPKNYGGSYAGSLPLRQALAYSLNTVAVRLIDEVGPAEVAATARSMGVRSPLQEVLSLALGSSEVTPMDMAMGFSTLARMGERIEPVYIRSLKNHDGELLGEAGDRVRVDGEIVTELPGRPTRVVPAGTAYEMVDMLTNVFVSGTARGAHDPKQLRGGKTGTTNDSTDTWFVGFTTRYTVAVWIGTDEKGSLGPHATGSSTALPAWKAIVEGLPSAEGDVFPLPDEAMLVRWNGKWVGVSRATVSEKVFPLEPMTGPLPLFPGQISPIGTTPPRRPSPAESLPFIGAGSRCDELEEEDREICEEEEAKIKEKEEEKDATVTVEGRAGTTSTLSNE